MITEVHQRNITLPPTIDRAPKRVLHIVENLNCQAVESWLIRILRAAAEDYAHINWTFFCALGKAGQLDETARSLGAEVILSECEIGNKIRFIRSLRRVMRAGSYDILHCHHDIMSAAYLVASTGLPFQKRIVHVHNTALGIPTPNRVKADIAREPMRQVCLRMADRIVGISRESLESLVGATEQDPARHQVVHYAVDTSRFRSALVDRVAFRRKLGFSATANVVLFVGRMVEYKNPCFVVSLLDHLVRIDPDAVAIFAGSGDQEDAVREMVNQKDLDGRVRLLGFRDDVPELMLGADVMVWPSLEEPMEGLGLGIIEAQAAGLPVVMSRSVPKEAIVVPDLIEVLPLAAGADSWAGAVHNILTRPLPTRQECLRLVESSSFSMAEGVASFMALYDGREKTI